MKRLKRPSPLSSLDLLAPQLLLLLQLQLPLRKLRKLKRLKKRKKKKRKRKRRRRKRRRRAKKRPKRPLRKLRRSALIRRRLRKLLLLLVLSKSSQGKKSLKRESRSSLNLRLKLKPRSLKVLLVSQKSQRRSQLMKDPLLKLKRTSRSLRERS